MVSGSEAAQASSPLTERLKRSWLLLLVAVVALVVGGVGAYALLSSGDESTDNQASSPKPAQSAVTTPPEAAPSATSNTLDESTVKDVTKNYVQAYNDKDAELLDALFASDLIRTVGGGKEMNKSEALAEYRQQFHDFDKAGASPDYRLVSQDISANGKSATDNARYRIIDANGDRVTGSVTFYLVGTGDAVLINKIVVETDQ